MADTYCGKSCTECVKKEQLNCSGCMSGPGRQYGGDCELADCCRNKGHETCATCGFKENCRILGKKSDMPQQRIEKKEVEAAKNALIAKQAPILGKWLWILFWLVIPSTVAGIMTMDTVAEWFPGVFFAGQILSGICSAAYGYILLQLSQQETKYKTAGIYALIASAASLLIVFISGVNGTPDWTLVITLPAAVIGIIGEYNEYLAHSDVLNDVNREMSENWRVLWKWYIGLFGAMLGSILILIIIPILGALVIIGSAIGVAIISIVKLVYLYRTAKIFREYPSIE